MAGKFVPAAVTRWSSTSESLHTLTLSPASRTQDHDQTAGHHSGPQQLLPSELFLNQSISEDRHKESRLCTALQAHKSTHQELPLSTGWAHTAFRELS